MCLRLHGIETLPHIVILLRRLGSAAPRKEFKYEQMGLLKKDRLDKLDKIGFLWCRPITSKKTDVLAVVWDQNFVMYCDFVEKNGTGCDPKTNSEMSTCIHTKRQMNGLGR